MFEVNEPQISEPGGAKSSIPESRDADSVEEKRSGTAASTVVAPHPKAVRIPVVASESNRGVPPDADGEYSEEEERRNRFLYFRVMPAWLISTFVHVLILLVLALVTIPPELKTINVLSAIGPSEDAAEMEEFEIEEIDAGETDEIEQVADQMVETEQELEIAQPAALESLEIAAVPIPSGDLASEMAPASVSLKTLASANSAPMGGRSGETRKKLLQKYGGNAASESAVGEALKWLSLHQLPNGAWTFQHNLVCRNRCGDPGEARHASSINAATALGVLPFLGAGQTHMEGEYKDRVRRALLFLANNGRVGKQQGMAVLDLTDSSGNFYSHGLASIALCEAYAMTRDPALMAPAQASLNFIAFAQARDGGWRYNIQPAEGGDTSVTGWQIMALKSGHMGYLHVSPETVRGSIAFLDKVQGNYGATYGYMDKTVTDGHLPCSPIGLLCRMYTGWDKNHPGIIAGVERIGQMGVQKNDIYYDYYAAQVLRHNGGAVWDKFNVELRDWLVAAQSQSEGEKGSWHFPASRSHRGPLEGGRLASTSFACMILEVYYRHMPLYAESAALDDFPL